jgi:hypothetical protein
MTRQLPRPGEIFDRRYSIEAVIGRGGFSTVFRAEDEKLGRPVALKLLSPEAGADDRLPRFWREVELSRGLVHPHTVRVYDFGVESDELPFIALELLDGESLQRRLQRCRSLSTAETRRIASCVLKSLMEAHALGIVHRDIKPANVFLCGYAGETDFVKVLDFGIAKAPSARDLTAHGWLIGTPIYMAPEQILGTELTPRADLYSLGLLMVMMLTGAPLVSGSTQEVIADQLSSEPWRLPAELAAHPLAAVIRRAIEKDPSRRYASAAEMLGDLQGEAPLERTLTGPLDERRRSAPPGSVSPVAFPLFPTTSPPHPGRSRLRARWPLVLSAALVALLALGTLGALALALTPRPALLEAALGASDPGFSPVLLRLRCARAGFQLDAGRRVDERVVELDFTHALAVGVIRVEEHPTRSAAAEETERLEHEGRGAAARRGRRVVSLWAAPRGQPHFDRVLAQALLASLE